MIRDAQGLAEYLIEGLHVTAGEARAGDAVVGATIPETVRFGVETIEGRRFLVSLYETAIPTSRAPGEDPPPEPATDHVRNALQVLRGLKDRKVDGDFWVVLGAAISRLELAAGVRK